MKTYDIDLQRLTSVPHDKSVIETSADALVLPRPARGDSSSGRCLRLPVEHARTLLLKQQLAELDKLQTA